MIRQYELVESIRDYNGNTNEALLNKAYIFAMRAHGMQKRANGDPYFSHPIEVASILTKLRLDDVSIVTALLHDTIEDTNVTKSDIEREFGEEVANLVDGVTKLTKLELSNMNSAVTEDIKQAENFRKLLLAVADDIRVLLVKLADRLHNMRTIGFISKPEKRVRIAKETQELYAPLAGRIGVQFIREELEDLCFQTLNPQARDSIISRIEALKKDNPDLVNDVEFEIQKKMAENGIQAKIYGRLKSPYSIYEKMRKQSITFEELADVIGFRVIVGTIDECYRTLGIVHQSWPCVPGRFKDYISMKKRNGYQSIHTTVMIKGHKVEIQMRTQKMHDFAEHGVAAHWGYKQNGANDMERYGWVRELIDYMKEGGNALELLEYTKMEIFHDKVFCFTPKGKIIRLPRGATAIDFAYAVHSSVGDRCVGVRINGMRVPLRTALHNGDTVSIITSAQATPSASWEEFAVTGKARNSIRRSMREQEFEQYVKLGRSLLQRELTLHELQFTDETIDLITYYGHFAQPKDLFHAIGIGSVVIREVLQKTFPDLYKPVCIAPHVEAPENIAIPISGLLPNIAIHLSHCCDPIPGDRIIGLLKDEGGVDVHGIDCHHLEHFEEHPEVWVDLKWDNSGEYHNLYTVKIMVHVVNEPGALGQIASVIGRHNGNISNLSIHDKKNDFFSFLVELEVYDIKHLQNIINALQSMSQVSGVDRMK